MTAIASYYASLGISIDKNSLSQVQNYLDSIQKRVEKLQTNLSKSKDLSLRINNISINQAALRRSVKNVADNTNVVLRNVSVGRLQISSALVRRSFRNALMGTGTGQNMGIQLNNFHVNSAALTKSINDALNVSGRTSKIRISARLSQESLSDMRSQVRRAINQLVISPTINPRINPYARAARPIAGTSGGTGGGRTADRLTTRNPRSQSPWHNPMMIGGAAGAMMRYGAFSLPFVAGAFGLNTLSKNMESLQNAEMAVRAQVGDDAQAANQLAFLHRLGNIHGVRMQDMAPGYSQMFAAAQGTVLEPNMQSGFQSFLQYASVIGMNEEQKKGAILALSQIVGKGGKNFAQELNLQLTNQGMPNARRLFADAVADGDLEKFEKMMASGEVGMEGVVKFLDLLGTRAKPYMADFYKTITRASGVASKANEDWLKSFMSVGKGVEGVTAVYDAFSFSVRGSVSYAEKLGDAFRRAGLIAAATLLLPIEFSEWMSGETRKDNFFETFFGEAKESAWFEAVQTSIAELKESLRDLSESYIDGWEPFSQIFRDIVGDLSFMEDMLGPLISITGDLLGLILAFNTGGLPASVTYYEDLTAKWSARNQAESEARETFLRTGERVPRSIIRDRQSQLYRDQILSGENKTAVGNFLSENESINNWLTPSYRHGLLADGIRSGLEWFDSPSQTTNRVPFGSYPMELFGGPGLGVHSPKGMFPGILNKNRIQSNPVTYSGVPLGHTSPMLPESMRKSIWEIATLSKHSPNLIEGLEDSAIKNSSFPKGMLPENTPPSSSLTPERVTHDLNIMMSGTVRVEGEVETFVPDIDLRDILSGWLEQEIGAVIPQTANVAK